MLYGGSFDPIHFGHLIIARCAAEKLGVTRTVLIPSANPPHKHGRELGPAEARLEMCRLAVADDPLFEVSDWEVGKGDILLFGALSWAAAGVEGGWEAEEHIPVGDVARASSLCSHRQDAGGIPRWHGPARTAAIPGLRSGLLSSVPSG